MNPSDVIKTPSIKPPIQRRRSAVKVFAFMASFINDSTIFDVRHR